MKCLLDLNNFYLTVLNTHIYHPNEWIKRDTFKSEPIPIRDDKGKKVTCKEQAEYFALKQLEDKLKILLQKVTEKKFEVAKTLPPKLAIWVVALNKHTKQWESGGNKESYDPLHWDPIYSVEVPESGGRNAAVKKGKNKWKEEK